MKCHECFHYWACGQASKYVDTEMCKNALPRNKISLLENDLKRAQRENKRLKMELEFAQQCIDEIEEAYDEDTECINFTIEDALHYYRHRHDDSL